MEQKELVKNDNFKNMESPMKSKKQFIIYPIIFILLIITVGIILLHSSEYSNNDSTTDSKLIDPFNYIDISFVGLDGRGQVVLSFDSQGLAKRLAGYPFSNISEDDIQEQLKWIARNVEVYCTPEKDLKNGDQVEIVVISSNNLKDKVESGKKQKIVQGLEKAGSIDVFKDITVSFSGMSGSGKAEIVYNGTDPVIQACDFRVDRSMHLSNGETITVYIDNVDHIAMQYSVVPKEYEKTYVVSGLSDYLQDASKLPIETIKSFIPLYIVEAKSEEDWIFTYGDVTYCKTYFMVKKEDAMLAKENFLMIFVAEDVYQKGEFWKTNYTPLKFQNLIVHTDGTVDIKYDDGFTDIFTTDMDSYIEELKEKYYITEIVIE